MKLYEDILASLDRGKMWAGKWRITFWVRTRAGRYYHNTGLSRDFFSVIRILIQFGRIAIVSNLFIVTISC